MPQSTEGVAERKENSAHDGSWVSKCPNWGRPRAAQECRGEAVSPNLGGPGVDSWKEMVPELHLEDEERLARERGRGVSGTTVNAKAGGRSAEVIPCGRSYGGGAVGREVLETQSGEVLCCAEDFEFCPKAAGKPLFKAAF